MKKLIALFYLWLIVCGGAYAVPVTWTLTGATFLDSTTITGSFVFDADTNTYSNWNISTQAGHASIGVMAMSAQSYNSSTPGNSIITNSSTRLWLRNVPLSYSPHLRMAFDGPLTNAGGTVNIDLGNSYECINCSPVRNFATGALVASVNPQTPAAVPTLGEWGMIFMAGLMAMLGIPRIRRSQ